MDDGGAGGRAAVPRRGALAVVASLGSSRPYPARARGRGSARTRGAYKRPFDLAVLTLTGVALAPVWLPLAVAIALAIRLQDGGPVLYRQVRLGRAGRPFEIVKFRTMRVGAEHATGPVLAVARDARATPVGRWLRRLRLDEMPQAVNVLRGEMSLVGPRPERPQLAALCEREAPGFARRLAVRPGLAGLAQARGGYRLRIAAKLCHDLRYIETMGPWLDLKLCALCILRVVAEAWRGDDASWGAP